MLEFIYILIAMMLFEYASTRTIPKYYYVLLVLLIVAASFSLVAPGNTVRADYFNGEKNLAKVFLLTSQNVLLRLWDWLPAVSILMVLFLPYLSKIEVNHSHQRIITPTVLFLYPFFIIVILAIGFVPAFWSVGSAPPTRTINVLYWLFIFSCLSYTVLLIAYLKQHNKPCLSVPTYVQWIFVFLLFRSWFPQNNFRTASMDLISGRAMIYNRQMDERYVEIKNSRGKDVVLSPLKVKPKSIFFSDIEVDHQNWKNICTADYFHLKSLALTKTVE